jgi:signal transduction histidine kinase
MKLTTKQHLKTTSGTSGEKGFGFGLPLVKHLIDSMNGSLKVDSVLGEYSRFEIRLPV